MVNQLAAAALRAAWPDTANLRCGYHAWTYDLGGRLVAAPNLARMADIDRDSYGLLLVRLREWLGYAWDGLAARPGPARRRSTRSAGALLVPAPC